MLLQIQAAPSPMMWISSISASGLVDEAGIPLIDESGFRLREDTLTSPVSAVVITQSIPGENFKVSWTWAGGPQTVSVTCYDHSLSDSLILGPETVAGSAGQVTMSGRGEGGDSCFACIAVNDTRFAFPIARSPAYTSLSDH